MPATFSKCQEQPWGTWQHTNGAWKRGDYVGLLVQWRYDKCQAFVAQDIDVSTLRMTIKLPLSDLKDLVRHVSPAVSPVGVLSKMLQLRLLIQVLSLRSPHLISQWMFILMHTYLSNNFCSSLPNIPLNDRKCQEKKACHLILGSLFSPNVTGESIFGKRKHFKSVHSC